MRAEPARGETLTMAAAATAPDSPAWHAAPASDRAVSANGGDVDRADTQWTLTTAAQTVPSAWLPAALTFELRAPAPPPKSVNPWKRTADAGESIGRGCRPRRREDRRLLLTNGTSHRELVLTTRLSLECACAFTSSTRATCRSASPSSRRAGCSCWPRRRPPASAIPSIVDETLDAFDARQRRARRRRRHRHPHRQRAARLRGRPRARASAARTSSTAASTRRCIPDEAAELGGAHAVVRGDGDLVWGRGARRLRGRHAAAAVRGRPRRRRLVRAGALGPAAAGQATCGRRCRPCAAARSTARSARCGAPTARSRACAASTRSSARSSSCGGAASASSRSPTTTSIRSR